MSYNFKFLIMVLFYIAPKDSSAIRLLYSH